MLPGDRYAMLVDGSGYARRYISHMELFISELIRQPLPVLKAYLHTLMQSYTKRNGIPDGDFKDLLGRLQQGTVGYHCRGSNLFSFDQTDEASTSTQSTLPGVMSLTHISCHMHKTFTILTRWNCVPVGGYEWYVDELVILSVQDDEAAATDRAVEVSETCTAKVRSQKKRWLVTPEVRTLCCPGGKSTYAFHGSGLPTKECYCTLLPRGMYLSIALTGV